MPAFEANEIRVADLFSELYTFEIPIFQRPLSWAREHYEQLITDIEDALMSGEEQYFLGSIVLNRIDDKEKRYEVIDGQQRLTALTVLLAVIRDLIQNEKLKAEIQSCIYQEEISLKGIPARMRVIPWENLKDFFEKYVYKPGGTEAFIVDFLDGKVKYTDAQDPVYHLYEAVSTYRWHFRDKDEQYLKSFTEYLLNNIYLVYIITTSRSSAFRIFNVLNTRGLPLSHIDILKSLNLEAVQDESLRKQFAEHWRSLEEDIGREELEEIVAYARMIKVKEKAKRSLSDEYEELFRTKKLCKGKEFFDYIFSMVEIYRYIVLDPSNLRIKDAALKNRYVVLMDIMKRYLPFSDWIPPLMAFYNKFHLEEALVQFLLKLEKKVFMEWVAGFTSTERITSMAHVLKLIERSNSPHDVIDNLLFYREITHRGLPARILDFENKNLLEQTLISKLDDPQFYSIHGGRLAKYMLLRIDMDLWDLENFPGYPGTITVEHILPRAPPQNSEWVVKFSESERQEWTNKLGNLVLLSGRKNSAAGVRNFSEKKETYFKGKCTPFRITQEIMNYHDWTIETLKKRHQELLNRAKVIYLH